MNNHDVARMRMHRQRLWGTPLQAPEDVVGWLGAVQAQEFPFARWSVAQRSRRGSDAAISAAFDEGRILRTHVLRPTWHFVLPADIRWMLGLTAPRVHRIMASYEVRLGLDAKTYVKTNRVLSKAVAGRNLTRKELGDALERARIEARGQRLAHIVMHAELEGILCSGPMRAKQHTYALLDERAPAARALNRDEALAELTRRYFTSHGPATLKDFAWWSGLTASDTRKGIEAVSNNLVREEVAGRTFWFTPSPARRTPPGRADLVQVYDECVIAYTQSRDAMLGSASIPVVGAYVLHAILFDAQLIGFWRPRPAKTEIVVQVSTFRRPTAPQTEAIEAAVQRYARFTGVPTRALATRLPEDKGSG